MRPRRHPLRRTLAVGILLALLGPVVRSQTTFVNPSNGHGYFKTAMPMTAVQARTAALAANGYVVALDDAAEEAWIEATFGRSEDVWIGLSDEAQEGVWRWSSGEPVTYVNWCANEPDDGGPSGNEDYVIKRLQSTCLGVRDRWSDLPDDGNTLYRAIIEVPDAVCPPAAPLTVALMTGFAAGAAPGLSILETRLQAAFGCGLVSEVFPFNIFNPNQQAANAAAWILSQPAPGPVVLIGHSLGAPSAFDLAANQLAVAGVGVELCVSLDYVALASPCQSTTPPAPSNVVTTLNYFQQSTGICPVDWRSSPMVVGAAENVSMEFLFDDPAITHTSIDCDERVHRLLIDRLRNVLRPEPYPGTGDDLALLGRVDALALPCQPGSGVVSPGILAETPIRLVSGGSAVALRAITPEQSPTGSPFGLIGIIVPTAGLPAGPVVPGFHVDPAAPGAFVLNAAGLQFLPSVLLVPLAGGAYDFEFCWPVGLPGISLLLQSVVLDPGALNGIFATSPGLELRGL